MRARGLLLIRRILGMNLLFHDSNFVNIANRNWRLRFFIKKMKECTKGEGLYKDTVFVCAEIAFEF